MSSQKQTWHDEFTNCINRERCDSRCSVQYPTTLSIAIIKRIAGKHRKAATNGNYSSTIKAGEFCLSKICGSFMSQVDILVSTFSTTHSIN